MIVTFASLGLMGRFCNGAYQVAGTIGVARRNNADFAFPLWINHDHRDRFGSSEGVNVYEHFANPLPLYSGPPLPERWVDWGYQDAVLTESVSLKGHFQSEKYFSHALDEIRWYFRMKDEPSQNDYVAIHWRAGDYTDGDGYHPRLTMDYYRPAMAEFHGAKFLVFSDDIAGAKRMFGPSMEYSEGRDYLQDFKQMKKCQPAGTIVRTPDGNVPIEQICEGVRVTSYSGVGQVHTGIAKLIGRGDGARCAPPGRVVESAGSRPFAGKLTILTTDTGKQSKYTPNHLSIIRLGDALNRKQLVYLMRKGDQFRVGVTGPQSHARGRKTDRAVGCSDIRTRLNSSQADDAWVLASFNDRDQALLEEKYISAKFGIPEVQFDGWRTDDIKRNRLLRFWGRFGVNVENARRCLSYYNRRFEYPFCRRHRRVDLVRDKESIIPACNVLNGMKVLDADIYMLRAGGKGICDDAWREVTVTNERYDGPVYSMDVEINQSYIGDGIVTHNCRHFIIANSSYSAMAAVLSDAPDKRVIAPRPWFGKAYTRITADDIYGSDWKVIDWGNGR
jgi:hypothetical protein